jgi:hypothetical protein
MLPSNMRFAWILAVLVTACASGLPSPTPADEARAHARWPGASMSELNHGRQLYVERCASCHALKTPDAVAADQWPAAIDKMRKQHGVKLTDGEADIMERYLWSVASRLEQEGERERQAAR